MTLMLYESTVGLLPVVVRKISTGAGFKNYVGHSRSTLYCLVLCRSFTCCNRWNYNESM